MAPQEGQAFPLVPRRLLTGIPFGSAPSRRRGPGGEVVGSRAYRPGDPVSTIDWAATARLSSATGRDEFVVREWRTVDAPRVAIVLDKRPAMSLYSASSPWLSKPSAVAAAVGAIVESARAARAEVAAIDFADGSPHWLPPSRRDRARALETRLSAAHDAPEDTLDRGLAFLAARSGDLPAGSFVFVLSDFLAPPLPGSIPAATARGWDVVPVVVQDPTWERGFPDVGGTALPVVDPATGRTSVVRLGRNEVAERRAANAARAERLSAELAAAGARPVVLGDAAAHVVLAAFLDWADGRRRTRGLR